MRTATTTRALFLAAAAGLASIALAREQAELACTPYTGEPLDGVDLEVCQGPWLDKDGLPIIDVQDGELKATGGRRRMYGSGVCVIS